MEPETKQIIVETVKPAHRQNCSNAGEEFTVITWIQIEEET